MNSRLAEAAELHSFITILTFESKKKKERVLLMDGHIELLK